MNRKNRTLCNGLVILLFFASWTVLVQTVDVQPAGETGKAVGFATANSWFHQFTGVHLLLYAVTDWLGLVPVFVCLLFGILGLAQLIRRKSLLKVDPDLILLGIYYVPHQLQAHLHRRPSGSILSFLHNPACVKRDAHPYFSG